jgi:hypothetical protein
MREHLAGTKTQNAAKGAFRNKRMMGFEPTTFAMARRRSSQLSYIREEAASIASTTAGPT